MRGNPTFLVTWGFSICGATGEPPTTPARLVRWVVSAGWRFVCPIRAQIEKAPHCGGDVGAPGGGTPLLLVFYSAENAAAIASGSGSASPAAAAAIRALMAASDLALISARVM